MIKRLFWSLLLPICWALCVLIDVFMFTEERPVAFVARAFEDLVFVMSFIVYRPGSAGGLTYNSTNELFYRFAIQFFVWWVISFALVIAWSKFAKKKAE